MARPKDNRTKIVEEVLASTTPREVAGTVALEHGLDKGLVWSWVLEAAGEHAAMRLPLEGLIERLLDDAQRARVIAEAEADHTLVLVNRLADLLPKCSATADQIHSLISALPADGSHDSDFETVLYHPAVAEQLLFELLDQGRCISALGHRPGPRRLLERLAAEHAYAEAITTLALDYYGRDDHPLVDFLDFVRKHRDCAMLDHNLRHTSRVPEERRRAAIATLDEAPKTEPWRG